MQSGSLNRIQFQKILVKQLMSISFAILSAWLFFALGMYGAFQLSNRAVDVAAE